MPTIKNLIKDLNYIANKPFFVVVVFVVSIPNLRNRFLLIP